MLVLTGHDAALDFLVVFSLGNPKRKQHSQAVQNHRAG